jgi:hypothetical protein
MEVSLMTAYVAEPAITMRITSAIMYLTVLAPNLAVFSWVMGLALDGLRLNETNSEVYFRFRM